MITRISALVLVLVPLALAGVAAGAPLSVPVCNIASPPQLIACSGNISAGPLSQPFSVGLASQTEPPRADRLPVRLVADSLEFELRESLLLGADGNYTTFASARLNYLPLVRYALGGVGTDLHMCNDWCYENVLGVHSPVFTYNPDHYTCKGAGVSPPTATLPYLGGRVPSICVDPVGFMGRLRVPGVVGVNPSHYLSLLPMPVFEEPYGSGNGLVGFWLRPYEPGEGPGGCYGHVSGGGGLGTQLVCITGLEVPRL